MSSHSGCLSVLSVNSCCVRYMQYIWQSPLYHPWAHFTHLSRTCPSCPATDDGTIWLLGSGLTQREWWPLFGHLFPPPFPFCWGAHHVVLCLWECATLSGRPGCDSQDLKPKMYCELWGHHIEMAIHRDQCQVSSWMGEPERFSRSVVEKQGQELGSGVKW